MRAAVPGFGPQTHGFLFRNTFASVPARTLSIPRVGTLAIGNAANGLCGGMTFAARDFFEAKVPPPTNEQPPESGEPLFDYLVDRLVASFALPFGPAQYYQWMALPDEDIGPLPGVASRTRSAWLDVRRELDTGHPAPLGLIRINSTDPADLAKNHQVLAYAYDLQERTGFLGLRVYDPNHPGVETELTCQLAEGDALQLRATDGELTRGFFLTTYRFCDPRFLLRPPRPTSFWGELFTRLLRMLP